MKLNVHWPKAGEHLVVLAAVWIVFSLLVGLFGAFDAMERSTENIARMALIHALKTSGLMVMGGLVILGVPIMVLVRKNSRN